MLTSNKRYGGLAMKTKWKQVGDREELCETGILRITVSGHGALKGMYRKPVLLDGKPYYRFHANGKPKWQQVFIMMNNYFPDTDIPIDDYWYQLIKHLVAKHNILQKMKYVRGFDEMEKKRRAKKQPEVETREVDLSDAFQNDNYAYFMEEE